MSDTLEFLRFISTELTRRADHPVAVEGARRLASTLADNPAPLAVEPSTVGATSA